MRRLRALQYGLGRAFSGMGRAPLAAATVIGVVAMGFLLIGAVYLAAYNLGIVAERWGGGVDMVIYLEAGADADQVAALETRLAELPVVTRAAYVSPTEALSQMRRSLGELGSSAALRDELGLLLQEEFGAGMLPASIEVTLSAGIEDIARADWLPDRLRARIEAAVGVEEVMFVGDLGDRRDALLAGVRYALWGCLALLSLACIYIVAITMRLRTRVRRGEADVMALFGASSAFVRGPLILEGLIHGTVGAGLAIAALWLLFQGAAGGIRRALSNVLGAVELGFVPGLHLVVFLVAGAVLGMTASLLVTASAERS